MAFSPEFLSLLFVRLRAKDGSRNHACDGIEEERRDFVDLLFPDNIQLALALANLCLVVKLEVFRLALLFVEYRLD